MPQRRRRDRDCDDAPPAKRIPPAAPPDEEEEEEADEDEYDDESEEEEEEVHVIYDDDDEEDEDDDEEDDEEDEEDEIDHDFIVSDDDDDGDGGAVFYYDDDDAASEVDDDGVPDKGEIPVDIMLSQKRVTLIPSLEEALRTRVFQCAICQSEGDSRGPTPSSPSSTAAAGTSPSPWWKQIAIMQCGHTVCVSCWDQMRHADCPLCKCDVMWIGTYRRAQQ